MPKTVIAQNLWSESIGACLSNASDLANVHFPALQMNADFDQNIGVIEEALKTLRSNVTQLRTANALTTMN